MISFEKYLIEEKGYKIFRREWERKGWQNVLCENYKTPSAMSTVDNYYYPPDLDESLITDENRYVNLDKQDMIKLGIFCVGLHERDKPPTLILPRPKIKFKRIEDGKIKEQNDQSLDDAMNIALANISNEEIFNSTAIDRGIVYDITVDGKNTSVIKNKIY